MMKEDLLGYREKLLKELDDINAQIDKHGLIVQEPIVIETVEQLVEAPQVDVVVEVTKSTLEEEVKPKKKRGRPFGFKPVKKVTKKK